MTYQKRGEWLAHTSKARGASTNAVAYSRGAQGIVLLAQSMLDYGPVTVEFKGTPAGRLVGGAWGHEWNEVVNPTLARAIEKAGRS